MTPVALDDETDPVRRAIIAAINRLIGATPQRSTGRLSVSQLAVEAGVKRWHLTHQHTDLKDLFQARAAAQEAKRAVHARSADSFEELKHKHAELRAHCRMLEERLKTYATVINLLSLENAAMSDQAADAAKVRVLHPRPSVP